MIFGTRLMLAIAAACAVFAVVMAQEPAPIETCGTSVGKQEAEMRAVSCPEGFVGQWTKERAADSCEWQPKEPQWWACSLEIEPQGKDELPVETVPLF